jgi:hypothetical protein
MADIDPTALTALIISIVALVATTGQLLQQFFATADGYRRCLPSVMGRWGTKTERRWRWCEFRFETIYYVPRISVGRSDAFVSSISIAQVLDEDWSALDRSKTYALSGREPLLYGSEGIVVRGPAYPTYPTIPLRL